ncbi:pilus (MSHA type) biogenesis protein MshL [Helicobacter sp. MIT 14-3879]|uniref:pilus (MSHA type) biogenesis protein MshL n=1 Tax=Helicobacter sp. MIT 14-3879 TaxID=2040649 RepID=UPI0015F1A3F9|nr:pilus (MSHA type) biogenesis protein MshL [Helicobacter sp. MIT 14-3879]
MRKSIFVLVLNLLLGSYVLQADSLCEDTAFSMSASSLDGTSVGDLLEQLALKCEYSMLVRDRAAKDRLSKPIASVNIVQLPLEKIFDLLLTENELNYEFDGKLLKISYLMTETFKINYIGTSRIGSSNTDIILSQNAMLSDTTTASTTTQGSGLQASGGANFDTQSAAHRSLINSAMQGGSADSITGTKIRSVDEFDFWGKIEKEIFEIAFRPGDAHQPKRKFSTDTTSSSGQGGSSQNQDTTNNEDIGEGQSVVVNKTAGLITVTGTIKQIERVRKYIKELEEQMQNQVMIDVNILTVTHSNANTVGVDWNQLYNLGNLITPSGISDTGTTGTPLFTQKIGGGGTIQLFSSGVALTKIVEFLNSYGKVRSVSNPKVLTLSNQPALISVGSLLRYTQTSAYLTATSGTSSTSTNTTYPSVFSGVLLDVTPSIQGEYIMLKINPSVTRTKDLTTENQATALAEPPNLSANQLSSLIRARDGDKIVIGGLISKSVTNSRNRVPLLGYIPIIKYLFSYDTMSEETNEMIIVITPHIIKRNDNPSLQDLGYSETVNEIIKKDDIKADIDIDDDVE